jgi:hypothetical protein
MEARALAIVVRPGDALGLRLTGVRTHEAAPGEEGTVLRALFADPSVALVAVEGDVHRALAPDLVAVARRRGTISICRAGGAPPAPAATGSPR